MLIHPRSNELVGKYLHLAGCRGRERVRPVHVCRVHGSGADPRRCKDRPGNTAVVWGGQHDRTKVQRRVPRHQHVRVQRQHADGFVLGVKRGTLLPVGGAQVAHQWRLLRRDAETGAPVHRVHGTGRSHRGAVSVSVLTGALTFQQQCNTLHFQLFGVITFLHFQHFCVSVSTSSLF